MAQSKMKTVLSRNRNLYRFGVWVKSRLPKRFYYSSAYTHIISLNKQYERPDQKETVQRALRRQLANYLREAVEGVPYYRDTVKVRAADINESNAVDALKEFPYLQKSTVMDNREAFLNRRFKKESLTYYTSGGSTGRGIGVWRSKEEIDIENAFVLSEWGKLGLDWEKSRIVRIGADASKRDDEDPFKCWANRLFVSTFHLHSRWMEEIYQSIIAFKPDFIWSYPSGLELLAGYLQEHAKPPMRLRGILLSSETLLDYQYALFKRIFDSPVSDLYGLTERTNMAFSRASENGDGFYYRLVDTYGYSENCRDEYGNDEIVGTSYWNIAMPLIRYRTYDIGAIDENGVIRKLQGRTQDFVIDKKGRRILAVSINIRKCTWDFVTVFQLVQNTAGELIIRIVPNKHYTEAIKEPILNNIRQAYGEFFDVKLEVVGEITRTKTGKRRSVVCNLEPR
jgi:phenylacetate-CoA ligase